MIRKLSDAVVDSDAALARSHVFLRHLHPAQGTHRKTLTAKQQKMSRVQAEDDQSLKGGVFTLVSKSVPSGAIFSSSSD